jgi:hypothetical protein
VLYRPTPKKAGTILLQLVCACAEWNAARHDSDVVARGRGQRCRHDVGVKLVPTSLRGAGGKGRDRAQTSIVFLACDPDRGLLDIVAVGS